MTQEDTSTLEFRDYLRVLRRHKWIIAVTLVVCVGIAMVMSVTRKPVYTAGSNVLLEQRLVDRMFNPTASSNNPVQSDRTRANEIQVMSSPEVRTKVAEQLGFTPTKVDFEAVSGTDIVVIRATGSVPTEVAKTANVTADTYLVVRSGQQVQELNEAIDAIQARIDAVNQKIFFTDQDLAANPPAAPFSAFGERSARRRVTVD